MSAFAHRFDTVTDTIGHTPLVPLDRLGSDLPGRVWVKLEARNPGGSVKDRIGRGMIDDAEARGVIKPGKTVLVEPTSGNTGIAIAMIGAARGYKVILTMPESMSVERRKLLAAYGAELVLTPRGEGMQGSVDRARELAQTIPHAFIPGQFENPANPRSHYETTGPEVLMALERTKIGAFVAGVGTGGTISGVGRYLKDQGAGALIVAVEPQESPIIGQKLRGERLTPAAHGIQGIGANFIPDTLDLSVLDSVEQVSTPEAIAMARRMASVEGLLVGISSGGNVHVALRLASLPEMQGKAIVTVAPSTGERYLSTPLWEGVGEQ
ncbi:MAG: cysteine synthase A [Actinobacteria bacterium HGW-Actinobacteria-7]|nr:MAG: cysteine synthase A [Actinobacteria bacterium HGW-Actinobacteria-7]